MYRRRRKLDSCEAGEAYENVGKGKDSLFIATDITAPPTMPHPLLPPDSRDFNNSPSRPVVTRKLATLPNPAYAPVAYQKPDERTSSDSPGADTPRTA